MPLYYGILTVSVIMFGIQFFFSDKYQRDAGNGAYASFLFSFAGSVAAIIVLAVIAGFDFSLTPFAAIWSLVVATNNILFTIFSLKALERVNLSVFSLFSMLGGMLLPFFLGLIFYGEPMTLGKGVSVVLITAALAMTVTRTDNKGGGIYYLAVFVLNGMCGVLAKIYEDSALPKVSDAGFSLWVAIASALISGIALLALRKQWKKPTLGGLILGAGGGALEKVANFLLLIALAVLPASVQYPFITGGVMITSAAFAYLTPSKPGRRELASIGVAFLGLLALVLIPI